MGRNNLVALSAHGDHCSWRAVALVHQAYEALRKEIAQNHLNPKDNSNYDNESSLLNEISSNLKDAIVNETKNLYLKEHKNIKEPLYDANEIASITRSILKINNSPVSNSNRSTLELAMSYFNRVMAKNNLISLSHEIINSKFSNDYNA